MENKKSASKVAAIALSVSLATASVVPMFASEISTTSDVKDRLAKVRAVVAKLPGQAPVSLDGCFISKV